MMWPVGDFHDGKNELSQDELIFAEILGSGVEKILQTLLYEVAHGKGRSSFLVGCQRKGKSLMDCFAV